MFKVKTTAVEARRLRREAAMVGVTVPRLLVEKARGESPAARRMVYAELIALRRDVRGFVTNVNQLARWANTEGRFPAEAARVGAEWAVLESRIRGLLRELRS